MTYFTLKSGQNRSNLNIYNFAEKKALVICLIPNLRCAFMIVFTRLQYLILVKQRLMPGDLKAVHFRVSFNFVVHDGDVLVIFDPLARIKQEDSYSELMDINAGVPQGSVLGPVLYLLYTSDMPEEERNTTATFADDTAFLTIGHTTAEAASELNRTLSKFERWTIQWRIKLNEKKSVHVDFTYRNQPYVPVYINNQVIPFSNQAKYLGMTLDAKLKWKEHVKKKRQQLDLKYNQMRWLMGRSSPLPIENKILLYNMVLKPIWTYGICLYGVTSASNRLIIERFQNKVLREMVNAPWYIRNDMLHRDLGVEYVKDAIQRFALAHQKRLQVHDNSEAVRLLDVSNLSRRLKRKKPLN
ncbi:hypothetical protein WDU94_005550 [Cyamophila willieti]